jgi:hypothetical protein
MDLTVREHIQRLTSQLDELNRRLLAEANVDRRMLLETEIDAVSGALAHYRAALDIEKEIKAKKASSSDQ